MTCHIIALSCQAHTNPCVNEAMHKIFYFKYEHKADREVENNPKEYFSAIPAVPKRYKAECS